MAAPLPEPAERADPSAPRARVLDAFPYPIAHIYRRVVDARARPRPGARRSTPPPYELLLTGSWACSRSSVSICGVRETRRPEQRVRGAVAGSSAPQHQPGGDRPLPVPALPRTGSCSPAPSTGTFPASSRDRYFPRLVRHSRRWGAGRSGQAGLRGQRRAGIPLAGACSPRGIHRTHGVARGTCLSELKRGNRAPPLHYVPVLHAILGAFGFTASDRPARRPRGGVAVRDRPRARPELCAARG